VRDGRRVIESRCRHGSKFGTSGLKSSEIPFQLDLFDHQDVKDSSWSKVERTLETITEKFGKEAIKRGTLSDD
jgi:hypothetical protein